MRAWCEIKFFGVLLKAKLYIYIYEVKVEFPSLFVFEDLYHIPSLHTTLFCIAYNICQVDCYSFLGVEKLTDSIATCMDDMM